MARRKRAPSSLPPTRLPDDVSESVNRLATATGWSPGAALAFLVRTGWNALSAGKGDKIADYRRLMSAAVEHHEAEIASRKKLAVTSSKLREARKALAPSRKEMTQ